MARTKQEEIERTMDRCVRMFMMKNRWMTVETGRVYIRNSLDDKDKKITLIFD